MSRDPDSAPSGCSNIVPSPRVLILCVERDPHIRELETYFLDQAGFVVHFAEDGAQALELARSLKPAIVITEILVPGLDGLALCQRLKTTPETRNIPVVIFSLLAAEARAREAGAEAFLRKPLAEHRLVQVTKDLLGRSKPAAASGSA
ncbi:MAG TPA: response regulator [Gemmatimonadales bacterium]|nr:response regulator [Gemmatimonadales bacterium]